MRQISKLGVRNLVVGTMATFATLLAVAPAKAQMCETDEDCGFGFSCHQEVVSNTTTTGAGASATSVGTTGSPPWCGNAFCDETESNETCPEDCHLISYCVGASCETDTECAEDYSCQPAGGVYATTTTGGDQPLCGDRECDVSENADTCSMDCSTERTCQIKRCETDADCDEGFYCDLKGGVSVASVSGVGGGPGSGGTIELYQSQCLPSDGGSGGGASTDAGDSNTSATDGDPNTSGVTGGTATASGNVTGGSASGSGGSHAGGNGHHWPWPRGPHRPGCSVAATPAGGALPLAGLFGLIAWAQIRRRSRSES